MVYTGHNPLAKAHGLSSRTYALDPYKFMVCIAFTKVVYQLLKTEDPGQLASDDLTVYHPRHEAVLIIKLHYSFDQ